MAQRPKKFTARSRLASVLAATAIVFTGACAHEGSSAPGASPSTAPSSGAAPANGDGVSSRGGASVFVVHMMSDFDAFKKFFEEGAAARAKAGVTGHLLSRLDDGRVVVHLIADDAAKVQAALDSPELERYLDRKGAPDASVVWLTDNALVKIPPTPPTGPTFSLYLKVHVTDFAALERGFQDDLPLFAEHGVIGEGLHRSTDKEDIAVLHFMGTSREKLEALAKHKAFAELLARAGSKEEAKPLVGADVSRSRPE